MKKVFVKKALSRNINCFMYFNIHSTIWIFIYTYRDISKHISSLKNPGQTYQMPSRYFSQENIKR